jgi:excisionase family DNA binding protein
MNRDVRLLTITEVAERLSISVGTMRWRRHLGLPPHPIKVGRNLRYPETEVDAYVEALREAEKKRRAERETPQAERGAARSRAAW